jgi:hypothetical protein
MSWSFLLIFNEIWDGKNERNTKNTALSEQFQFFFLEIVRFVDIGKMIDYYRLRRLFTGPGLLQTRKCSEVKQVNEIQSLPFTYPIIIIIKIIIVFMLWYLVLMYTSQHFAIFTFCISLLVFLEIFFILLFFFPIIFP